MHLNHLSPFVEPSADQIDLTHKITEVLLDLFRPVRHHHVTGALVTQRPAEWEVDVHLQVATCAFSVRTCRFCQKVVRAEVGGEMRCRGIAHVASPGLLYFRTSSMETIAEGVVLNQVGDRLDDAIGLWYFKTNYSEY